MEKIIKSVIVGLLAALGFVILLWVFGSGLIMLMTFIGNLTGSVFMGAMAPFAVLFGIGAGLLYSGINE